MKELLNTLKKGDFVIIFLLILISFFPFVVFAWQQTQVSGDQVIATITLENEMLYEINLSEHEGTEDFDLVAHDHKINTIELSDGRIRIKSATCSDQICVRTGFIQRAGQTIVCLPHQLIIEIQTVGNEYFDNEHIDIISS